MGEARHHQRRFRDCAEMIRVILSGCAPLQCSRLRSAGMNGSRKHLVGTLEAADPKEGPAVKIQFFQVK